MSEDINNPNNGKTSQMVGSTDSSYKDATAVRNDWESTEVPLTTPPVPPFFESNQEVVAISEKKSFPIILIPLFIIIISVLIGVTYLLLKQTQKKNLQTPVQITPSPIARPTLAVYGNATPSAAVSISPTIPPPSDTISDIENEFNKLDSSTLDVR